MLTAPSVATTEGVTIWGDDTDFFKFYLTSARPRIRLDATGDPVFLMVQYAISDQDREADPKLPDGAGYMAFDVTFETTEAEVEAARALMQPRVDAEWARRGAGTPEERASRGVAGTVAPPAVEFGAPTYTAGTVNMYAPQSDLLVDSKVAGGVPDLMSGNIAVFNMDLTSAGSEFMRQTLTGGGGSDLTPIQVAYGLKFWARLPPVDITVTADSSRIYEQTRQYMDGAGTDHCTTYDFQNTDLNTSLADVSGLIEVKIDPGSASVDPEVLEELRQYALDMMQSLIESRYFTEDPAEGYFPEFPEGAPEEVLERERGRQRGNQNSKKYLRKVHDKTTMHLELNLKQHSVVEWQINPQSTLETFFAGRPAHEMSQFVRQIRLDSPFFQNLNLTTRMFADFANTDLKAVEVALRYAATDFDGQHVTHERTLTFTDAAPQVWSPSLIGSSREVEYRVRTQMQGRDFGPQSPVRRTSSNALNIAIASPGVVEREVVAGDLNFAALKLNSVQVRMAYEDAALGVAPSEQVVMLTPRVPSVRYVQPIGAEPRAPVRYSRRFAFDTGEVIEDDAFQDSNAPQLFINQPFSSVMEVRLLPVGRGWSEVAAAIVQMSYSDEAEGFSTSETITLKTLEEMRTWVVRLRNPAKTAYRSKTIISYKNGDVEPTDADPPWRDHAGGGVLPIQVREPTTTEVVVVPNRLVFAVCPLTEVVLHHPASGARKTLTFTDPTRQTWQVPVRPSEPLTYTAQITHFPAAFAPVTLDPVTETDTALILPPFAPPRSGQLSINLLGRLIDFARTPLVTVDLLYEDEANDLREATTLAFDADNPSAVWKIEVKDANRRLFRWQATYFVAPDNAPTTTDPQFSTANLVVLPRLALT